MTHSFPTRRSSDLFAADGSGKLFGIPPLRRIAGKSQHLFVIQRPLENFRTCLERAAYGDYWIARLGGLKQPLDGRQRFISRLRPANPSLASKKGDGGSFNGKPDRTDLVRKDRGAEQSGGG